MQIYASGESLETEELDAHPCPATPQEVLKWNTDTGLKGNITTVSHQDIF
jgi:hypothetical protein